MKYEYMNRKICTFYFHFYMLLHTKSKDMKNLCVQVSNVFKWQKIACMQILKISKQLASLNI